MPDQTLPERLLRPREAAEILQLSTVQIYRLVRTGELPAVVIGRSVRFRSGQLAEFINANNINTKPGNGANHV